jgi:thiamine-monophosphate kinase
MNEIIFLQSLGNLLTKNGMDASVLSDDCAHIETPSRDIIATTDMVIDRTHFDLSHDPLDLVARKSVCVNLSDLAAAGAKPMGLLVALAIPRSWSQRQSQDLMTGIVETASLFDCAILGGDTNSTKGPLTISITALGFKHWRGTPKRGHASHGDLVFVTGELGGSFESQRHLRFTPRLRESTWLMDHINIHAMMDLSDGLASDAKKIAIASKISIILDKSATPIHRDLDFRSTHRLEHAMCDGEDFELLFTVSEDEAIRLEAAWPFQTKLTQIGRCERGNSTVFLVDESNHKAELTWTGYEH